MRRDLIREGALTVNGRTLGDNCRGAIIEDEKVIRPFDRPLKEISLGMVLLRLFQISRRFNVVIQPQLVLLQKTLLNVEGLGRQLDQAVTAAGQSADDVAQIAHAVKGLVDGRYQWVVFTSTNAVRAVWEKFAEFGLDARAFSGVKIACVGEQTAAKVRAFGINPEMIPSGEQSSLGLLDDFEGNRFEILRSLTMLRRLALDPSLVDEELAVEDVAKLDYLTDKLDELLEEKHAVLVFSQFTGFLRKAAERLDEEGVEYAYLDGSTTDRPAAIEKFTSGEVQVFLISLKAGGFGLNLACGRDGGGNGVGPFVHHLAKAWREDLGNQNIQDDEQDQQVNDLPGPVLELELRQSASVMLGGGGSRVPGFAVAAPGAAARASSRC